MYCLTAGSYNTGFPQDLEKEIPWLFPDLSLLPTIRDNQNDVFVL